MFDRSRMTSTISYSPRRSSVTACGSVLPVLLFWQGAVAHLICRNGRKDAAAELRFLTFGQLHGQKGSAVSTPPHDPAKLVRACWLGGTEPRGDIQKNKLWNQESEDRESSSADVGPPPTSRRVEGPSALCHQSGCRCLLGLSSNCLKARPVLPLSILSIRPSFFFCILLTFGSFRFRATNVTVLTSDHPLLVSAAHHNGHSHGKELGRELPSRALGRIPRSLLDHQRLYRACRR